MKHKHSILFILTLNVFLLNNPTLFCQPVTGAKIENIDFELLNNKLVVNYDITNYSKGEKFYVWLEIYNTYNHQIVPQTVTGDVNDVIEGGNNKSIIWDVIKDNPEFEDDIYIKVFAVKYLSYEKLMLLSTLYPGLGNYKINDKKIYWTIGSVAYGSLVSSIILEQIARSNYDKYKIEFNTANRDLLLNKALTQR